MAVSVVTRPIVSGFANWNAAGNPIIYTLQRYDMALEETGGMVEDDGSGNARIIVDNGDVSAYFTVGDRIYFKTQDNAYAAHATVTAVAFVTPNTKVTVNIPFTTDGGSGGSSEDRFIINLNRRTDYRLYINFKDYGGNNKIPADLTFSPDSTGIIRVDAQILKNYLDPDITIPSGINETDLGAEAAFYLSYREFYDNAFTGTTNDSLFDIHAVFAAMQIGSENGGNMIGYIPGSETRKFLQKFQPSTAFKKMVMWRDWPFTVSFIYPEGLTTLYWKVVQYNVAGVDVGISNDLLTDLNNTINRLKLPALEDDAVRLTLRLQADPLVSFTAPDPSFDDPGGSWSNVDSGGEAWDVFATPGGVYVELSIGEFSDYLRGLIVNGPMAIGDSITSIDLDAEFDSGKNVTFRVYGWDGSTREILGSVNAVGTGASQVYLLSINTPTQNNTHIEIYASCTNATGGDAILVRAIQFLATTSSGAESVLTETLDIEIRDVCGYNSDYDGVLIEKNPIHLWWKNSVGGDAWWNFGKYHEYQYTYSNGRKAKRVILFENNLHPVQWEALQDLNTTGEVYQNNIAELTSSIVKTSTRVGQQVFIVSRDGETKTGVIVIPTSDSQLAKNTTNMISIEIELPEQFTV